MGKRRRKYKFRYTDEMKIKMATKYLPDNRRDLTANMVNHSVANVFAICVKLKLFRPEIIIREVMSNFAINLYKHTMKRHTHLWNKEGYLYHVYTIGAPENSLSAGQAEEIGRAHV